MQNQKKCYQNVWILSGTADGPILAERLIKLDYIVFISVVSYKAGNVYPLNSKLHIFTGILNNKKEIKDFILKHQINFIVDATHPFAINISKNLISACSDISLPIFRYERVYQYKSNVKIISNFEDMAHETIKNKNILLAIGSRALSEVAKLYSDLGANIFARILATPHGISKGFSSCINHSRLAILNPNNSKGNNLEYYLCKYWSIDYILCRDSGGYSQIIWDEICLKSNIKLFLLKRPRVPTDSLIFSQYDDLIQKITQLKC